MHAPMAAPHLVENSNFLKHQLESGRSCTVPPAEREDAARRRWQQAQADAAAEMLGAEIRGEVGVEGTAREHLDNADVACTTSLHSPSLAASLYVLTLQGVVAC